MWPRDAYVGQRVVCVLYDPHPEWFGAKPQLNTVYTIAWVGISNDGFNDVMIDLLELPSPEEDDWERGFAANCFKPVDESRLDVFRKLLEPVHADA